jgi:pyridoxine 5-phosphate synthase
MTRLSVNINKVALIRNSRGGNLPDLAQVARDCEAFGAQGITVHPRPDERHIRYADIPILKQIVRTELNIEGNPTDRFMEMVLAQRPHQVTLVPDAPGALTSDRGWDTVAHAAFLTEVTQACHEKGIRVSIFVDPVAAHVEGAKKVGADRIEFYTGDYAKGYTEDPKAAILPHVEAAKVAKEAGIGVNAGHDLNLENLQYYVNQVDGLLEVSIGHALITDALYYGLRNTIQMYLSKCGGGEF